MGLADLLILAALALLVVLMLRVRRRSRAKGCGCGCADCPQRCGNSPESRGKTVDKARKDD